jgi:riboflavin synthase alpha subunit
MFTGIIQAIGAVQRMHRTAFGAQIVIDPAEWDYRPREGDSVAVNGVCLTYNPSVDSSQSLLAFDIVRETLQRSTLGGIRPGNRVNLEPALTPQTPLGGHIVQGHVDGVGRIHQLQRGTDQWWLTIEVEADLVAYIVPKGSIAIDGISLTIASVEPAQRRFSVALIPTTIAQTTLGEAGEGQSVNLETDMVVKTIVHWLTNVTGGAGSSLTVEKLREMGFA